MSRIETLRRSVLRSHEAKLAPLNEQLKTLSETHREVSERIAALQTMTTQSAEEIAQAFGPVAEAMATLVEETRRTLGLIVQHSKQTQEQTSEAVSRSAAQAQQVLKDMQTRNLAQDQRMQHLETLAREIRDRPQPNPWLPALFLLAVLAAGVAAHRLGLL